MKKRTIRITMLRLATSFLLTVSLLLGGAKTANAQTKAEDDTTYYQQIPYNLNEPRTFSGSKMYYPEIPTATSRDEENMPLIDGCYIKDSWVYDPFETTEWVYKYFDEYGKFSDIASENPLLEMANTRDLTVTVSCSKIHTDDILHIYFYSTDTFVKFVMSVPYETGVYSIKAPFGSFRINGIYTYNSKEGSEGDLVGGTYYSDEKHTHEFVNYQGLDGSVYFTDKINWTNDENTTESDETGSQTDENDNLKETELETELETETETEKLGVVEKETQTAEAEKTEETEKTENRGNTILVGIVAMLIAAAFIALMYGKKHKDQE